MEKLKCKVILLPGNDSTLRKGDILKTFGTLAICEDEKEEYGQHHLYFVSERKVTKNDCYWDTINGIAYKNAPFGGGDKIFKKIEACTNKSLDLPGLPKHFVEDYIGKQGKIKEVYIHFNPNSMSAFRSFLNDSEGHCIVHPTKDSWNKQEIKELYNQWIRDSAKPRESGSCYFEEWLDKNY